MQTLHQRLWWPISLALSGVTIGYGTSVNVFSTRENKGKTKEGWLQGAGNFFNPDFQGDKFIHYSDSCFLKGGTCMFGAGMGVVTVISTIVLLIVLILSGFYDDTGLWMKIVAPIIGVIGFLWLVVPWTIGNNKPLGARVLLGALGLIGLSVWILLETYHIFPG